MKIIGNVEKYNGLYGSILGSDGKKYTLLSKDLVNKDLPIKVKDNVEFEPEYFQTSEIEMNVARFVKVLKKDKNN